MLECLAITSGSRNETHAEEWLAMEVKALHGIYHCQTEEVDGIKKSYWWLQKVILKDSTKELNTAAQEQALSLEFEIHQIRQDPSCSCRENLEARAILDKHL